MRSWDDDGFDGKVAALLADPPPVTSFTFGCPPAEVISGPAGRGQHGRGHRDQPRRGRLAAAAGADGLCVQGYEAGAHRGTFANDDAPGRDYGLLSLIGEVAAVTGLPQIAAGGIMGPRQVRARDRGRGRWPRSAARPSCAAPRAARTRCTRRRWPTRATPRPR